jgi:drug/metabolite transporter (DMT)-like permease
MLPFYWVADAVRLPVWLAERLWMSLIVSVAFWGALRLAERLGVGSAGSRLVASVAYALWPVFTIVVGSTSAAALPGAFLPWVLLPLTNERYSARVAAVRSALVIPFMGGVNAASTLASLLPVGLYLLSRPRGPRQRKLIAWWVPGVVLATAWWWIPLLVLGLVTAAIAYVTGIAAGRRLGSRLASFVALLEVVAGVGFAWLLLDELPRPIQLVGGLLILAGVVGVKLGESRVRAEEPALG